LKWSDYDGSEIKVERKVWGKHVGAPKTEAREAGIPVITQVRKVLAAYKKQFPPSGHDLIFRGEKLGNPLDLDNLGRRDIPDHINGAWFGWHAFRRGLGTRLYEANISAKDIQAVLRHADVNTTMAYYIAPDKTRAKAGMAKLSKGLASRYGITR